MTDVECTRLTETSLIRIGDLELHESLGELRRSGELVSVEPLVFRLLLVLARDPGRVVSKEELTDELWNGRVVSDSALTRAVSIARRLIRRPGGPNPIQPVYGTGYRLAVDALRWRELCEPARPAGGLRADRGSTCLRDTFVGRERELAQLDAAVEALSQGHGGLHLIAGEAGIGKTRLGDEVARRARSRGVATRVGRCAESAGAPSFWPWIQILRAELDARGRRAFRGLSGHGSFHLERMLREVQEERPKPVRELEAPDRFAVFDAVTEYLVRAARLAPLLVILDDLHCADRSSLELLHFLASELSTVPLLVVGSYRDVEVARSPEARREIAAAARTAGACLHALEGFTAREVGAFLEAELRSDALVGLLHDKSGGNPLFLSQLVAVIAASAGRIDWRAGTLDLPPALHDAIQLQLDGLTVDCRELLTAASVVGREFDLELLALATERDRESLLDLLDEAGAARLVTAVASPARDQFRFAHVLVRDCLYDSLGARERSEWHQRVAVALEEIHAASAGPHLSAMAHHFRSALPIGSVAKAIAYSERAGDYVQEQLAYTEAASELWHAIALLGSDADLHRRCKLLLSLSAALGRAGDLDGARRSSRAAIALGHELKSADVLAQAAFALSPGFFSIETARYDEELVALLEQALEASGPGADPSLRVRLLSHLASSLYWTDQADRRQSLSEEAMRLVGPGSDPGTVAHALYARHRALWSPDNIEERIDLARRAVAIGDELGDRESSLLHRALLITDLAEAGEVKDLDEEIARFESTAEQLHQLHSLWLAPMFRATRMLMAGRFEDTIALANRYRALGARIGSIDAENCWAGQLTLAGLEQGHGESMVPLMRAHAERNPRIAIFAAAAVFVAAEVHRMDEARSDFEAFAASDFRSVPRDMNWLGTMLLLAIACAELRDERRARVLLELLLPYRDRFGLLGFGALFMGAVSAHIGRLASIAGDRALAEDLLVQGREMNRRVGAVVWEVRALHDHAVEALAGGRASHTHAARMLRAAEQLAAGSEMTHLNRRISRTAERGGV